MEWDNFHIDEFDCSCCGQNEMVYETISALQRMRDQVPFPMIISSGYRCRNHPIERRKLVAGPHTTGLAVDIVCSSAAALMLLSLAMSEDEWNGFGINQRGDYDERFIHLDQCEGTQLRPRPHVWSY